MLAHCPPHFVSLFDKWVPDDNTWEMKVTREGAERPSLYANFPG